MKVTSDDVRHIAKLARLQLRDEEVDRFTPQLDAILGHAAELEAADTGDTPAREADARRAPLAGDAPGSDPLQRPVSDLSASWQDCFFTVPRLAAMQDPAEGAP